ncbi:MULTISPECIES: ArsA family ATPase [unclassified Streptomyces]|uniref:ArsA family ATPase n=1 Tax=unclassified Streptomyces TaxID=2593676 RepID=UPI00048CBC01|nr:MULTISPECIES: ArsA family ATPase [unclassified Streptomyces]MYY18900.1 AAA family ATPase [Streptomyces sp. SID4912]SCD28855.1 arsenite efflux ATP-binding protein ArsA [Streptomyces sp. DpondAA-D4]
MTLGTGIASGLDTDALLDDPGIRIVVCCGSGGVGKTTTAAALGVRAAERGRRVVVLTIDPARRLAQSMGIDRLDNVPRRVDGIRGDGELHAMMLDMKRTFDETVEAHTDAERARAILENPFYQSLSAGFAGTQEYMAMEKLGQLRARDEWDLIVVDTPPSRSALDFLDAPKRLGSFLDGKFIRLLIAPAKIGGRAGMKFLNVGMSMMTGTLGKLLGGQFLRDVQTFVAAMDSMFGGFRTRADATYQLLQAPGTAFLVVATPERDALREAAYFVERLAAEEMPLAGLVLNRVHGSEAARLSADGALAAAENLEDIGIVDQSSGKAGCGDPAGSAALTSPESPESAEAPEHHEPHGSPEEPDRPESSLSPEPPLPPEYREERPPRGHTARDPQAADPQEHRTPVPPGSAAHTAAGDAVNDGVVNDHAADHHTAEEDRPDGAGDPTTPTGPATPAAGIDADADEAVSTAGVSTDLPSDDAVSADVVSVEQLTAGLLRLHAERMQVVARERDTRDRFTALHPEVPVTEVAALPGDVHDLSGLRSVGERLATGAVPSTTGTA